MSGIISVLAHQRQCCCINNQLPSVHSLVKFRRHFITFDFQVWVTMKVNDFHLEVPCCLSQILREGYQLSFFSIYACWPSPVLPHCSNRNDIMWLPNINDDKLCSALFAVAFKKYLTMTDHGILVTKLEA